MLVREILLELDGTPFADSVDKLLGLIKFAKKDTDNDDSRDMAPPLSPSCVNIAKLMAKPVLDKAATSAEIKNILKAPKGKEELLLANKTFKANVKNFKTDFFAKTNVLPRMDDVASLNTPPFGSYKLWKESVSGGDGLRTISSSVAPFEADAKATMASHSQIPEDIVSTAEKNKAQVNVLVNHVKTKAEEVPSATRTEDAIKQDMLKTVGSIYAMYSLLRINVNTLRDVLEAEGVLSVSTT